MWSSLASWWSGEDAANAPDAAPLMPVDQVQVLRTEIAALRADVGSAASKKACRSTARKYVELRKALKAANDTAGADQAMRDMCEYLAGGALHVIHDASLEEQVRGNTQLRARKRSFRFPLSPHLRKDMLSAARAAPIYL
jgi:hypothetical protein